MEQSSATTRQSIARGWARKDLAAQVRGVAKRLPWADARAARLRDLALDLELAGSDRAAAPVLAELRSAGVELKARA